jgi:hypothetical protein
MRFLAAVLLCALLAVSSGDKETDEIKADDRSVILLAHPFGFEARFLPKTVMEILAHALRRATEG